MKKSIVLVLSLMVFFASCSGPSKSDLLNNIKEAEAKLFDQNDSFKFDENLAQSAIDAYANFATTFPEDSVTPSILFKEADLLRAMHKYETAVDIYKNIESNYSNHSKAPHSLFLQGFVYENEIGDLNKAKEKYQAFLDKYPDHDLADDVQFSLKNLGKSPEDIIKEFNQQKTTESDSII